MPNDPKNLLLAGYYGFHNTGDEAILKAMLDQFRSINKALSFTVVSGDPSHTSETYNVHAVHWRDIPAISDAVQNSDLVILGGGGLFQEYWDYKPEQLLTSKHHSLSFYGGIPLLASLHGKPLVLYGLGLGPIFTQPGKELMRAVADQSVLVSVREAESKNLLIALGVTADKIRLTADPAFGLQPANVEAKDIFAQFQLPDDAVPIIGVSLRNWNIGVASNTWKIQIARGLDRIVSATNGQLVFIPFQSIQKDLLQDDAAIARLIVQNMEHGAHTHIVQTVHSPQVTCGMIAQCDLLLGMRLHSLIFALQASIPVVGLSYDPKIDRLLKQFGLEEYSLSLKDLSEEQLTKVLQQALAKKGQLQEGLRDKSRAMKKEFTEFSQAVLNVMDAEGHAARTPIVDEFLRRVMLDKINQVAELEKKAVELDALRDSDTWQEFQLYVRLLNRVAPEGSFASKIVINAQRGLSAWKRLGGRAFLGLLWQRISAQNPLSRGRALQTSRQWEAALDSILEKHKDAKDVVVILPNIKWNVSLFQRPQQMALAFARQGYLVLYLELSYSKAVKRISQIQDRLYRVPIPAEVAPHQYASPVPFKVFERLKDPVTITYTYNMQFLEYFQKPRVVYEYIDELEVFPYERDFLVNNHRALLSSANVVVATAKRLYDEVRAGRADALLNPNGVDYHHFAITREAQAAQPPRDLKKVVRPGRPVIGYYGALARWFDYDLLAEVARQRPEWEFVLIGIDYDNTLHPSDLLKQPNVHWLGVRHYTELPKYLKNFDVATIPFKVNEITHSTSPLKMFEYFAGHKPVVATAMHEVERYNDVVLIAHDAREFIEQVERALTLKDDPAFIAKLDGVALANTWEARIEEIVQALV